MQYAYWDIEDKPVPSQLCLTRFDAFLTRDTSFLGQVFRTQPEAEQRQMDILTEYPQGFAVVRQNLFYCENDATIEYYYIESYV